MKKLRERNLDNQIIRLAWMKKGHIIIITRRKRKKQIKRKILHLFINLWDLGSKILEIQLQIISLTNDYCLLSMELLYNIKMAYQMNKLCQKLKQCNKILIGTGAGMGKDSGFWDSYPLFRDKFNFYLSANPSFLNSHPHLFWGFYGSRLKMYRQKKPHYGFNLLQKLTQKVTDHFIITSNVDGHFHKSFKKTTKIYQVHGSIHHLQCYSCDQIYQNDFQPIIDIEKMECINLPFCPKCKNIVRPNILMFEDRQWIPQRSDAQEKQYAKFLKGIKDDDKIAIIEIGCGTAVPTIRNMCESTFYRYKNSIFIRINPEEDVSSKFKDPQRFFYIQSEALQALTDLEKKTDNIR